MEPFYAGEHVTVYQGDCLAILAGMPDGAADAVITDPPYGIGYSGRWDSSWGPIQGDEGTAWLWPLAQHIHRLLPAAGGFAVVFYGWSTADAFLQAFRAAGLVPKGHLVFVKNQMGLGHYCRAKHEQALLFAKGTPRPQAVLPDVLPWTRVQKACHPTQKPLDAIQPLVERFSPPGGVVLDPYLGSGTTAVACLRAGRRAVGIELDPVYCATAANRLLAEAVAGAAPVVPGQPVTL